MRIKTTSLATFSHRGEMIALGTKSKILEADFTPGSTLQVLNADTQEVIFKKDVPTRFNRLEWGDYPDGLYLAGGLDNGKVTLWDATPMLEKEDPKELIFDTYLQTEDDILGIDFSPGMAILATGSAGGRVILWNMRTMDKPLSPGGTAKYEGISCVQWNQNIPQILAIGTTDGAVGILDLRGKNEVARLTGPYFTRAAITSLQWNPALSTQMAVSSSASHCPDVMLYDLRVTKGSPCLKGHTDGILKCVWSKEDPSLVVTCSRDGTIMAWDAKTLEKRGVILNETVFDFGFNPEHPDTIIYSSYNGEVVVESLTALNAQSPFMEGIPKWHKQAPAMCFVPEGLVYFDEELKLREWAPAKNINSEEWKIIDAFEKNQTKEEIINIIDNESSPMSSVDDEVDEQPDEAEQPEDISTVEIDSNDPVTEKITQGNIKGALKCALKKDATLAALIALCNGPEVLKKEKNRILRAPGASSALLLLISIFTGAYNDLVDKNVSWKIVAKIVGKHCTDEEFIPKMHCIAETLEEKGAEGAGMCYLIARDLQKYQQIEESKAELPTSIHEASNFYEEYGKTFSVIEKAAVVLNEKVVAGKATMQYLQYLSDRGESKRIVEFTKSLVDQSAEEVKEKILKNIHPTISVQTPNPSMQRTQQPQQTQQRISYPSPNGNRMYQQHSQQKPLQPPTQPMRPPMPVQPPTHPLTQPIQPPKQHTPPLSGTAANTNQWPVTPNVFPRPGAPMNSTTTTPMNTPAPQVPFTPTVRQVPVIPSSSSYNKQQGPKIAFVKTQAPATPLSSALNTNPSNSQVLHTPTITPAPPLNAYKDPRGLSTPSRDSPAVLPPTYTAAPPAQQQIAPPVHPPHLNMGLNTGNRGAAPPLHPSVFPTPNNLNNPNNNNGQKYFGGTPAVNNAFPSHPNTPSLTATPTPQMQGGNFFSPFPGQRQDISGAAGRVSAQEVNVTPEMDEVYKRIGKMLDALLNIINNKKGSLKNWLLKTVQPKLDVLRRHISEKRWPPEFVEKMSLFTQKIEELGIHEGATMATNEQLESIRKFGEEIVATKPAGTGIEVWISAIYSLLKVALH